MRLHFKVTLLLLLLGLIPLVVMGSHALFHMEDTMRENVDRSLLTLSTQVSKDIQRTVNEGVRSLHLLARNSILTAPGVDEESLRRELLKTRQFHPIIKDIVILDGDGRMRTSITHSFRGNWAQTLWFKHAMLGKSGFFGVHALIYPYSVVMTVSSPLLDMTTGNISGVIVAHLDMTPILEVVQTVDLGPSGWAMIVDSRNMVVASNDLSQLLLPLENNELRQQLQAPENGTLRLGKGDGRLVGAFSIVQGSHPDDVQTGWRVVLLQPRAQAYAGVNGVHQSLLLAVALCLFTVALLSMVFSRTLKHWLLTFTNALQSLGKGDFDARIPVQGSDEIAQLGAAVNSTAEKLQESSARLHRYQDELEEQVRMRTAELETSKNDAEQANHAKDEFLASMSHEIRTPLNAITGLTEIVLQGDLPAGQREALGTVLDSAEHLRNVFDDMLDLSLAESKHLELTITDFDLHTLLRSVVNAVRLQTEAKGLTLKLNIAPDAPRFLRGDPGRLRQILFNIAGNAVKFTTSGSVTIQVGLGPAGHPETDDTDTAVDHATMTVLFSIRDTGPGIPQEMQQVIFESFRRGESFLDLAQRGAGLGLAICRKLIDSMGGRIWLDSAPKMGSEFFFTIPFLPGDPGRALMPGSLQMREMQVVQGIRLRVLVVEDNPTNIQVITLHMDKLGQEWRVAEDGQQALDLLRQERFDLVFMDVEMPGMNGLEATKRIRAGMEGVDPSIPIVALTAHTTQEVKQNCFRVGMDDFLTKPVRMAELAGLLKRFTPLRPALLHQRPASGQYKSTSSSAVLSSEPVHPLDRKAAMERLGIDEETYAQILTAALGELEKRLVMARDSLKDDDMDSLRRHAHTMKSSSKSIGAGKYNDLSIALEQASLAKANARCAELLDELDAEVAILQDAATAL